MKCWSHKWGVLGVWLLIKYSAEFATLLQIQVGFLDWELLTKWMSATPLSQAAHRVPPCLHTPSFNQCRVPVSQLCYTYRPKNRPAWPIILQVNIVQSDKVTAFSFSINYDHRIMKVNPKCEPVTISRAERRPWEGRQNHSSTTQCCCCSPPTELGGLPTRKWCSSWGRNSKNTDSHASNISNKCLKRSFNTNAATRLWRLLALTPWSMNVQLNPVA